MPPVTVEPFERRVRTLLVSTSLGLALTLAATAWLLAADGALAQQSPPLTEEQKQACTADFKRLCPGKLPGGGRVKQCFETHEAELSPPCAEAFAKQQSAQ